MQQYQSLIRCIGNLKGVEVKLHIDKQVTPAAEPAHPILFHIRKELEKESEQLEQ